MVVRVNSPVSEGLSRPELLDNIVQLLLYGDRSGPPRLAAGHDLNSFAQVCRDFSAAADRTKSSLEQRVQLNITEHVSRRLYGASVLWVTFNPSVEFYWLLGSFAKVSGFELRNVKQG